MQVVLQLELWRWLQELKLDVTIRAGAGPGIA